MPATAVAKAKGQVDQRIDDLCVPELVAHQAPGDDEAEPRLMSAAISGRRRQFTGRQQARRGGALQNASKPWPADLVKTAGAKRDEDEDRVPDTYSIERPEASVSRMPGSTATPRQLNDRLIPP